MTARAPRFVVPYSPPMQGEPRLIRDLTGLGLTTYEAKAYVALLGRDSFTAAQVARQGQLPRQRIYDVLGSLVEKGLASSRPGSVVKYAAVAPELAIERLVAAHRRSMGRSSARAEMVIAELTPVFATGRAHTDPLEYIEVLRDAGAINERFAELQNSVKRRDPRLHQAALRDAAPGERRGPRGRAHPQGAQRLRDERLRRPAGHRGVERSSRRARSSRSSKSCR